MPTYNDFEELKNYCTVTWTTQNGVSGRLFTGTNGNTIFFPAAGYRQDNNSNREREQGRYWASSLYTERARSAGYLWFDSGGCKVQNYYRYLGYSVRAVYLPEK